MPTGPSYVCVTLSALLALMPGCSYAFIRAPHASSPPAMDPAEVHCNNSSLIPSLDAAAGGLALAASGAGIIEEHTSDKLDHFTLHFAGPLLVAGIVLFYSASFGTSRVERCQ